MGFKSSFTIPAVAAMSFCLIGGTTPAYADLGDQLAKLLPDDGEAGDLFGFSVAINGATAIVGAYRDDDNGETSGSAYLFDISDPENPRQIAKLLPNDGAAFDGFGISVAISDATAIVGAYLDDENGSDSGAAYLFDTTTGQQIAKLLPNDGAANDWFAGSVAISGATAIVGAHGREDVGSFPESAYLFDTTTGQQLFKLMANDGEAGDEFGRSVAISGTTAIVGAHHNDDNGSAYLFDTTTGAQIAKLLADDGAMSYAFGWSVAISGTTAIVGAFYDDDNGPASGSAYLFDTTTGRQMAKLLPDDGEAGDAFGWSVAISGTTAIVGAWGNDDNGFISGSAYLFDTATDRQIARLLPNDGAVADQFGFSVAISGATAVVGAPQTFSDGNGSAYLFDAAGASLCPWDLDGSDSVGASDLLSLLVSWGPCKGCPADFDGNGTVGASDLLALLVNWGPCP